MPAAPGPDSQLWRVGFPRTSLLLAARALVLQVAHPTIGAGVRDFSSFSTDPWGRLDRTVTSLMTQLFGGEQATLEAQRLRRLHLPIAGTRGDGLAYRASEPDAWAWVHVANADTVLTFLRRYGRPLRADEEERYWADWRQAGLVLGIGADHLPGDIRALRRHVDEMAATTLEDNVTVRAVLSSLTLDTVGAPSRPLAPLWTLLRPLGRTVLRDATIGTLPPALRTTLALPWTAEQERRLRSTAALVRAAGAAVPDRWLHYPMAYRAMTAARHQLPA